jgi:putative transposase
LGIATQTFYRWPREFGGLKIEQAKQLKALEQEQARLRWVVTDLMLDRIGLKNSALGSFRAVF